MPINRRFATAGSSRFNRGPCRSASFIAIAIVSDLFSYTSASLFSPALN